MRKDWEFSCRLWGRHGHTGGEDACSKRPTPTAQQQLKSFLGLALYYRRFGREFSCAAGPLYRLLQKDRSFMWTPECQQAFSSLQGALMESPTLTP